ncbi:MAG: Stage V sporulation protein E [Candidatus Yanofskybacteria bacterium GW2011_GWA1_44_21]|uniref:Probable peptidoglycan glycosyltransferase FtsW n=2 Tax=Parcubacteria group TaxID=1794811 RepID=A0A1F8H282_9BACT|nr:MAG: Stage V sporulation protein E [Candidatus Wolfebacteria bacterium GW2011_GWB1_41_12]KKT28920.1 MAG: Stage V sporulation protein E [Candidatus Yanofskybacteria bacterium GW2011_GWA2_44_10]KKT50776.1 MAG: Stage V sporulation protein E [Candidatus Yanofskybacteria bacterium GW2011_GWA1_44_21]OGN02881.1 MAG: cell division protein FtsW [Candidatus Yanofskybacteria bacterium RIFCSPHIGHO2_01_FULL_44_110b]OGN14150.1 MAG: cell division protein FtsW [Candidatus Yanofskybacteria bacterium RIFCSPHI
MVKGLIITTLILVVFGLVMLSSAGIIDSQKKFGDSYYYPKHQLFYSIIPGLILMFFLSKTRYKIWKKLSFLILFGALILTGLVFLPGYGFGLKGATRWINISGFVFQPSETLKLALIIYLAAWFSGRRERVKNWFFGGAPFFVILGVTGAMLALQPDIGTLIVVTIIALGLYFVAGVEFKKFVSLILVLLVILSVLIWIEPYRFERVKTFLNPSEDTRGSSYQINQALISIGSGGIFGVGYGKSTQKFGFLPEVVGDSIFAVIAEELGYVGSVFTISLFVILSFILLRIAKNADDKFGMMLVTGINIWICAQAFVNIAAISGLAPLTGIPLPFISYGGTAMIALLAGLGIVLNVAKS